MRSFIVGVAAGAVGVTAIGGLLRKRSIVIDNAEVADVVTELWRCVVASIDNAEGQMIIRNRLFAELATGVLDGRR